MISLLLAKKIAELFLVLLMGYFITKAGVVSEEGSLGISKLTLYLIIPCCLLDAFQIDLTREVAEGLAIAFFGGFLCQGILILLGEAAARLFRMNAVEKTSTQYSNAGNLIIPLVTYILGPEWVVYCTGFMAAENIGFWSHCVSQFAPAGSQSTSLLKRFVKIVTNVNILAIIAGVVLMLLHIRLPEVAGSAVADVGNMLGAVSMLIIGMNFARMDLKSLFRSKRVYLVLLLRMIVFPLLTMSLLKLLRLESLTSNARDVLLITNLAAMAPAGATVTQFAQIYHREPEYASAINVLTTLSCIITMPLMVALYEAW